MVETVINEKRFTVKPFKSVRIGDPMYFDEIAAGSPNKTLKKLTCDFGKIPFSNRTAGVRVRQIAYDYNDEGTDITVMGTEMVFYSVKNTPLGSKIADVELRGEYMPTIIKDKYELGCDTACFEISVDGNDTTMHTGADGYYGYAHHYKNNDAYVFSIFLDEDAMTYSQMVEYVSYLFSGVKVA